MLIKAEKVITNKANRLMPTKINKANPKRAGRHESG